MEKTRSKILFKTCYYNPSAILFSNVTMKKGVFLFGEGKEGSDHKRSVTKSGMTVSGVHL